jgi:hypothetical protein
VDIGPLAANLIAFPGYVSTKTAGLTAAKLLFNSVLFTPNIQFMTMDIKDFYLSNPNGPLQKHNDPAVSLTCPQAIYIQNNLSPLIHNGSVYVKICKGMYGLPQATTVY